MHITKEIIFILNPFTRLKMNMAVTRHATQTTKFGFGMFLKGLWAMLQFYILQMELQCHTSDVERLKVFMQQ